MGSPHEVLQVMCKSHRESGRAELMVGDRERLGFPLGVLQAMYVFHRDTGRGDTYGG